MSKERQAIVVISFAILVTLAAVAGVLWNTGETQEGGKRFDLEIISERDNFYEKTSERSDRLFLGEFLRTVEGFVYDESPFGIFVVGWHGMEQDFGEEYWWMVSVDGESAMVGVDDIPLIDGETYTFTLTKGF
jgi:hypothetical protein